MTPNNPPEPLQCPDSWKYTREWKDCYDKEHGSNYLSQMCKHSGAGFTILYYIYDRGEIALTKIKLQNLFIKRVTAGTTDPTRVSDQDIRCLGGQVPWAHLGERGEELFEVYNAQMAPPDILLILHEVKAFMDAGQLHCESIVQYLANARVALAQKTEEMKREQALPEVRQQESTRLWDVIDEEHSKVREGFVYLLSNALMPGVYKIGFTASNPDKRAREVSSNYGLPMPFEVIQYWRTRDPYIVEQRIHKALASYARAGEFFEVNLQLAKASIEGCILS